MATTSLAGPSRVEYLRRAVREAPGRVRLMALQTLTREVSPEQLRDLLCEMSRSEELETRLLAVEGLEKVRSPGVFQIMLERFREDESAIRERATAYLRAYATEEPQAVRAEVLHMLSQGDDATRLLSLDILFKTGSPRDVLIEILLYSRGLAPWLKDRVLDTLRGMGDVILRGAVDLLSHSDEDLRNAALDALAQIGTPESVKPIVGLLRDPRPEVRVEVVRAVGRFGDHRILPLLKKVAEQDPAMEVRTRAVEVSRKMAARLGLEHKAAGAPATPSPSTLEKPIDRLLARAREMGASDLHLAPGEPPIVRQHGKLARLEGDRMEDGYLCRLVASMLDGRQQAILAERGELDFCYAIEEVGRYRVNAHRAQAGLSAAFRVIPNVAPTIAELGLPAHLRDLADLHQGIVLVTGPAGSGKSSTLTALVDLINEQKAAHILTLEDPVEFVHASKQALVNQREVGTHTTSFAAALRAAIREDPDVILVGEMRDLETINLALTAASMGVLVFATLHTNSAAKTMDRIINVFPSSEQDGVRRVLASVVSGVLSQQLLRTRRGGRVAAVEMLFSTPATIRDGKTHQIDGLIQLGRSRGMVGMDDALRALVESDAVAPQDALEKALDKDTFRGWLIQRGDLEVDADERSPASLRAASQAVTQRVGPPTRAATARRAERDLRRAPGGRSVSRTRAPYEAG